MRNKKSLLLFAIIFLWMFNATKIIALFANKDIEIRKLDELPSEVNSSIYYWIDETTLSADLLNTISIYGWLVSQPDDAMNEKEVAIIFKSDQEIYEIPAEIFPENNVLAMLKGKGLNISNENIRFGISFSSLAMKQGVYQMFLSSRGNEGELGLVETNIFFERNNMGLEKHYAESETITAPHSMPEEKINVFTGEEYSREEYIEMLKVKIAGGDLYANEALRRVGTFERIMFDRRGEYASYKYWRKHKFDNKV